MFGFNRRSISTIWASLIEPMFAVQCYFSFFSFSFPPAPSLNITNVYVLTIVFPPPLLMAICSYPSAFVLRNHLPRHQDPMPLSSLPDPSTLVPYSNLKMKMLLLLVGPSSAGATAREERHPLPTCQRDSSPSYRAGRSTAARSAR